MTERGRRSDRQHRAAVLDEFLQLRNRSGDRHTPEPAAKFGRDALGRRLTAETAAARGLPRAWRRVACWNAAIDEHEDVVLRVQISGIERLRMHRLHRKLV